MSKPTLRYYVWKTVSTYMENLGDYPVSNVHDLVKQEVEVGMLTAVMEHTGGNQLRAAALLGINRGTLRKKLREHKLT